MKTLARAGGLVLLCFVPGCAHLDFEGGGLIYYEPKPYFFVSTTKECVTTGTVVVLPEARKTLRFVPGYGSADLSASMTNGMLTAVGQKTDTKVPETISAVASLATAAAAVRAEEAAKPCTAAATLYPIVNGVPDRTRPLAFPVEQK